MSGLVWNLKSEATNANTCQHGQSQLLNGWPQPWRGCGAQRCPPPLQSGHPLLGTLTVAIWEQWPEVAKLPIVLSWTLHVQLKTSPSFNLDSTVFGNITEKKQSR